MDSKVYDLLEKLEIEYDVIEHPPLFSSEDTEKYNIKIDAKICKNLFLRNSNKSKYYLYITTIDKRVNLKELQSQLQESRLSFGDEDALYEKLKIKKGSVSIFNIVNVEKLDVTIIIDKEIFDCEKVAFHPNINTLSVTFNPNGLEKILRFYNIDFIKI